MFMDRPAPGLAMMSSYYGLPPGSLSHQEALFNGEPAKYDPNSYYSPGPAASPDPAAPHPGFARYPSPFEGKSNFMAMASSSSGGYGGLAGLGQYSMPPGQYPEEPCKQETLPPPPTSHPAMMFNPTNPLTGMVNSVHTQASQPMPIYPWMRPMNGGRSYISSATIIAACRPRSN